MLHLCVYNLPFHLITFRKTHNSLLQVHMYIYNILFMLILDFMMFSFAVPDEV